MPIYEITAPDGKTYEIEGPPGASRQDVIKAIIARNPMAVQTTAELEAEKSAPMSFGDTFKTMGSGVFGAGKSLVDFFGTGTDLAKGLAEKQQYLEQIKTPERQAEIARRSELEDRAARSGSMLQEAKAYLGGIAEAPFQSLAGALGSSTPGIVAGLLTLPASAPAALALGVATISKLAVGAIQGEGERKGSVFDVVKAEYMKQGKSEQEAENLAIKSSEFSRETALQTGGAMLLGALDAFTGVEPAVAKALRRAAPTGELTKEAIDAGIGALRKEPSKAPTRTGQFVKSVATEAPLEGAQGSFGQYAENVAAQQAGADVTPMQGVLGAGLRDAAVGALFGGTTSPLSMKSARQEYATEQFLRQAKAEQDRQKEAEAAYKRSQEERARVEEGLGVPKMLALPAPNKPYEEPKNPLVDPVGRITEDELGKAIGDNTVVNYLNKYRKENNLPKLKSYSIEDIKDAMTAQNPEGEEGALNAILAYKTNYQNQEYTPQDIQNIAVAKNVATETKGFSDFLTRATGKADLNTMTQPELHSVATALDALQRTGKEEQLVLPEGSNATRFTQDQYNTGLTTALGTIKPGKPVSLEQAKKAVQAQTGLETDRDAESLLRTAVINDDLTIDRGTGYQAISPTGAVLGTYGTESEAKRMHRRAEIKPVETELVTPRIEEATRPETDLPEGYQIQKEDTVGSEAPAAYVIREDGSQKNASQTFAEEADAKERLNILARKREANAAAEEAAADRVRQDLEKRQAAIAQMEADGKTGTPEHTKAVYAFQAANVAGSQKITDLLDKAEALRTPLKIVPLGKKSTKVAKHTVIKEGKVVASFDTNDKAQAHVLSLLNDKDLGSIVKRGGTMGQRAKVELDMRERPGVRGGTTAGLEAAGVHTPEVEAQLAELKAKLLPMLKKFGLEEVGLNVVRAIENDADGAWGKADKLIRIALQAIKPIQTMRHEALHALKELGFFTPQQWEALKRQAEKTWVNTYLKGQMVEVNGQQMTRYDAYANGVKNEKGEWVLKPLSPEDILEEAIADAFGDWEGGTKPPPGMMAALFKRMQQFFAALKQALTGAGFESADEIFGKIERGKLKAGKETGGTETKLSLPAEEKPKEKIDPNDVSRVVIDGPYADSAIRTMNSQITQTSKPLEVDDVGRLFDKAFLDEFKSKGDWKNPADFQRAVNQAITELKHQLQQTNSGLDWYEEDIAEAFKQTQKYIPSLKKPEKRALFSVIAGIMSPSVNARDNWVIAAQAYQYYEKTGILPGSNPATGSLWQGGLESANKKKQLDMLNAMLQPKSKGGLGEKGAVEWLQGDHTVAEITNFRKKYGGMGKSSAGGKASDILPGFTAFGPKVGPFVMNINGIHDVTVDVWMTRTFNRYFGQMMGADGTMTRAPTEPQRVAIKKLAMDAAAQVGIKPYQVQSTLWFFEQQLFNKLGTGAKSYGFSDGAIKFIETQGGTAPAKGAPANVGANAPANKPTGKQAVGNSAQAAKPATGKQGVSGEQKYSIPTGKFTFRPSGKGNQGISRGRSDTFGFVGPAGLGQTSKEHDVRTNREIGKRPNVEVKQGDGRGFTGFFSNISLGYKGKPNAKPYEPTLNVEPISDFVREYNNHRGNFDDHIATSIPGFREVQTIVGDAIAKTYKNADMLDIGASEGALIKAVTKMSNGSVRTVALDPNFAMAKHFNDGEEVEGSVYDTSAFGTKADEGQLAWNEDETLTDRDGQVTSNPFAGEEVRWFKPDRQFDVIHEAMVFQFISGNRASQIARAKELMKPDGVLIIEEKFVAGDQLSPEQFRANETQKDAYKEQYFTKAEIAAKAKAVGVAEKAAFQEIQEKKEQQVTGMNDLMVSPGAIEDVLGSNFDHVAQFWDSGNFKGYIASDSPEAVERLINNMLSTDSEFANVKTPRAVKYSPVPSDDGIVLGRLQPDAVEFPGVHYGNVQTDELQGSKYGTGIRGAERRRLQNTDDERIKNRVYFYINKPDGTMPIPESGVGNHVYTQKFKNILGPGKKMTEISKEAGGDFNYFESSIVDAGYDGYAVPEMGMMVILNHNVPVNYRGTRAEISESGTKLSLRTYFPTAEEAEQAAYKKAAPSTPEFKRFFGASKVKEEGRPQVMYHGSLNDFTQFNEDNRKGLIFVTPSPAFAEEYALLHASRMEKQAEPPVKVYPLWVRAETPFDYENPVHVDRVMNEFGGTMGMNEYIQTEKEVKQGNWSKIEDPRFVAALKKLGFDSLYVKENRTKNLAVFSANQVKSVTGNIGEFGENKDIRYSLPTQSAAYAARRDETTTRRENKGVIDSILESFAPESMANLRAAFIHRYNQLGVLDKMLAEKMGGKVLLADVSAEAAANMSDLSSSVTYSAFGIGNRKGGIPVYKNGATTIDNSVKGPLEILAPLARFNDPVAYQDYQYWAGVQRGKRFMAETGPDGTVSYREKNFSPGDIALVEESRKKYLAKGVDFRVIQKEMNTFNDGVVNYMIATGVISAERGAEFKKHMDYIPFFRQVNGDTTVGPKIFNSISGVKPPKKLKGSEAPLTDYLESIVRNTQAAINAGMKNVAAQRALNVAMQLGPKVGAQRLNVIDNAPDTVQVLENGKQVSYRVADQLFINAVKNLNMSEMPFLGFLSGPANLLRNLVTKDPGFMLANMARDSLSAWTTSGVNITPIASTAANFAKALGGKSTTYNALLNFGALGGYEFSTGLLNSASVLEADLNKKYGAKGMATPLGVFKGVWDALERGTEASDAATRMAVYDRVLEETGNETEALYRALEVMNFNRKGSSPVVRILTAAIPFLNARIQGLDVLYRTAFGKNVTANNEAMQKAFFVRGMTLMALSAAYFLAVSDDEEWKKQEQETKDNYWIAPGIGKFPTPFEVGFLFKTVPERIMAYTLKDDTGQDLMNSMRRGLLNTFAFNPIPQTFKPVIEYAANYNFFTGRPIVGQGLEGREVQYQVGPTTTHSMEWLGKQLGLSPIKLEKVYSGYTGTMGMYALTLFDSILNTQAESPNASKRFEQLPVFKRFAADPEARGNITQYYELKRSVDAAVETQNYLLRAGSPEEFEEFMERNAGLLASKQYVASIEKTMKGMREMRKMVDGAQMTADEKEETLTAIGQAENDMTQNIQTVKKMISEL
jgi:hypothetical protein